MAKILLADDDIRLMTVLALHLRNDDHEVVCAANAEDAIRAAQAERPDVMVLDSGLEDADGTPVHRRLAETPALVAIPAIYIVEDDMPRGGRSASKPGPSWTIQKPVPVSELLQKVNAAVQAAQAAPGRLRPTRPSPAPGTGRRNAAA